MTFLRWVGKQDPSQCEGLNGGGELCQEGLAMIFCLEMLKTIEQYFHSTWNMSKASGREGSDKSDI